MEVNSINYRDLHEEETNQALINGDDLSLISDVVVGLDVVIGKTKMTVSELYEIKKGGVLQLDSHLDTPVELVLNNSVVARGTLVVVGDSYGVQITESLSRNND